MDFRLSSTFSLRPILHTFPKELPSLRRKNKYSIFEVILNIYSEFYNIGTPHFSLEGVLRVYLIAANYQEKLQ